LLIQAPDYSGSVGVDWRFAHLAAGDFKLLLDANFYQTASAVRCPNADEETGCDAISDRQVSARPDWLGAGSAWQVLPRTVLISAT
jgi:hypothetical protein